MSNSLLALLNSAAASATNSPAPSTPALEASGSATQHKSLPQSSVPDTIVSVGTSASASSSPPPAASSVSILDLLYSAHDRVTSPSAPPPPPSAPSSAAPQVHHERPPSTAANLLALLSGQSNGATAQPPGETASAPVETTASLDSLDTGLSKGILPPPIENGEGTAVNNKQLRHTTPIPVPDVAEPSSRPTISAGADASTVNDDSVISLITPPGSPARTSPLPTQPVNQDGKNSGLPVADSRWYASHHLAASFGEENGDEAKEPVAEGTRENFHTLDLASPRPGQLPIYPAKLEFKEVARLQPKPLAYLRTAPSYAYGASRIAHLGPHIVCYAMSKGTIRVIHTLTGARTLLVTPDRAEVKHIVTYNGDQQGEDWLVAALTEGKSPQQMNSVVHWTIPRSAADEWAANIRASELLTPQEGGEPFVGLQWHPTEARMLLVAAKDRVLLLEIASPTEDILFTDSEIHAFSASVDGSVIASLTQRPSDFSVRLRDLHRVVSSWDAALDVPRPAQLRPEARVSSFHLLGSSGGSLGLLIGFDRDTTLALYDIKLRTWTSVWDFQLPPHVGQHFNVVRFEPHTSTLLVFNSLRSSVFCTRLDLGTHTSLRTMLEVAKVAVPATPRRGSNALEKETRSIAFAAGYVEFVLAHPSMSTCVTQITPQDHEGMGLRVFVGHAAGVYVVLLPEEGLKMAEVAPLPTYAAHPPVTVATETSVEATSLGVPAFFSSSSASDPSAPSLVGPNDQPSQLLRNNAKGAPPNVALAASDAASSSDVDHAGRKDSKPANQRRKARRAAERLSRNQAASVAEAATQHNGISFSASAEDRYVEKDVENAPAAAPINAASINAAAETIADKIMAQLTQQLPKDLDSLFHSPRLSNALSNALSANLKTKLVPQLSQAVQASTDRLLGNHLENLRRSMITSSVMLGQDTKQDIEKINLVLAQRSAVEAGVASEVRDLAHTVKTLVLQVDKLAALNSTLLDEMAEMRSANSRLESKLEEVLATLSDSPSVGRDSYLASAPPARLPEEPAPIPHPHVESYARAVPPATARPDAPDVLSTKEDLEDHLLSALSSPSPLALREALQTIYEAGVQRWSREPWNAINSTFAELSQPVLLVTLHRIAPALLAEARLGPTRDAGLTVADAQGDAAIPLGLAIPFLELCARSLRPQDSLIQAAYRDNAAKIREHVVRAQTEVGRLWNVRDQGGAWRSHWWNEARCREGVLVYLP